MISILSHDLQFLAILQSPIAKIAIATVTIVAIQKVNHILIKSNTVYAERNFHSFHG